MEEKIAVTLDFTKCKNSIDVYKEMSVKMEWEDWYGYSLDALWDILSGMPHKGDDFTILRPRDFAGIPYDEKISFTEYVDKVCSIFERAQADPYLDNTVRIVYTDEAPGDISPYLV